MTRQPLKYAKLAPQVVQAPGLFRSVKPGARKQRLEVVYDKDDLQFRFVGPYLLGVDDMRVLQSIVAIACVQNPHATLSLAEAGHDRLKKIKLLLSHTLEVRTTYDELARQIGYNSTGSSADTTIINALERLFTVSVFIQPTGRKTARTFEAGHIFERLSSDGKNKLVAVKLCPLLAFAVLGGPGTYMRDDLIEARKLKTDVARLLHMHLAWLSPGNHATVRIDTLVSHVYGCDPVTATAQRTRRSRVKAGVDELKDALHWTASLNRSIFRISRPSSRGKMLTK